MANKKRQHVNNDWPMGPKVTLVLIVQAVIDELGDRGFVRSTIRLTPEGQAQISNISAAKFMSEGFFRECLIRLFNKRVSRQTCADIAKLARLEGLVADIDEGLDYRWIRETLDAQPKHELDA